MLIARLFRRLAGWRGSHRLDRDTDAEIQFHLAMEAEKLETQGVAPAAAVRAARRSFGSWIVVREEVRDAHGLTWWDDLVRDTRIAIRSVRRDPRFFAAYVTTMALGASLATAIVAAADALIYRPLPYLDPAKDVALWAESPNGRSFPRVTVDAWRSWRQIGGPFDALAAYDNRGSEYSGPDEATSIATAFVSADFFRVLEAPAALGRTLDSSDVRTGTSVVVSHRFWSRRMGRSPDAIGKAVLLDGRATTVVGVMPRDFGFPYFQTEAWRPLADEGSDRYAVEMVARLTVPADVAQATLAGLAASVPRDSVGSLTSLRIRPISAGRFGTVGLPVRVLLAGAFAVLAIAAINGANLLLLRGAGRRREFSVRIALGAGRGRLIRQLLTETAVLAAVTAIVALIAARIGVAVLASAMPAEFTWQRLHEVELSGRTVAVGLAATVGLGLVLGWWPALDAARTEAMVHRAGQLSPGRSSMRSQRGKSLLIGLEFAVSTLLLIGAGLLFRSFTKVHRVDPGIEIDRLAVLSLGLSPARYPDSASRASIAMRLEADLRAVPGVADLTMTDGTPPQTSMGFPDSLWIEGREAPLPNAGPINQVGADTGYFRVIGTPVVGGRRFNTLDYGSRDNPVVIDPDLADRLWPGADPVGRRFRFGRSDDWSTVVGVAGNATLGGQDDREQHFEVYYPKPPTVGSRVFVAIRTNGDPAALIRSIEQVVRRLDPLLPIWTASTMTQEFSQRLTKERFMAQLVSAFALVGLALAMIGLYGVVSQSVGHRTTEIGIRVALGASSARIVREVVVGTVAVALAGIAIGGATAALLARQATPLLYQVSPLDPITFGAVPVVLVLGASLAAAIPSRRAAAVSAVQALRADY